MQGEKERASFGRGVTTRVAAGDARALVALSLPTAAGAQSAIIYGSLGVNQMAGSFSSNRYGMPSITATPTGVAVRYQIAYDAGAGQWTTRTLPHTVPWFSGQ